jgi:asparagine synthase (glutamine-hydrolysing)
LSIRRFWQLSYCTDRTKSLDQWKREILDAVGESVRLRMVADVPVGAFLSGGIDSAAVVALMAKHSEKPVRTFSLGSAASRHNELPAALTIARRFGTDHTPIVAHPEIVRLLPELVATYEEPYADPSSIPTFLIARETRRAVKVVLNGDGGDENFAGYVRYSILRFSEFWRGMPAPLHLFARLGTRLFHTLANNTLSNRTWRFEKTIQMHRAQRQLQYLSFFTDEEKLELYSPNFGRDLLPTSEWYLQLTRDACARGDDLVHSALSADVDTYLADDLLPKIDLGSMRHGLEVRSPLLDHHLLELTAQLPSEFQLRGLKRKWIFKKILKDILPRKTLTRRKTGFRLPLDKWFRHHLRDFVNDRLQAPDSPLWRYFDRDRLAQFIRRYWDTSIDNSDHVWALLWLDEWLRQFG